jgi:hypothetical protein
MAGGESSVVILERVGIIGGETARKWERVNGKGKTTAGRAMNERTGEMKWVSGWDSIPQFAVSLYIICIYVKRRLAPFNYPVPPPGTPAQQSWKWATSTADAWSANIPAPYQPDTIVVLDKP